MALPVDRIGVPVNSGSDDDAGEAAFAEVAAVRSVVEVGGVAEAALDVLEVPVAADVVVVALVPGATVVAGVTLLGEEDADDVLLAVEVVAVLAEASEDDDEGAVPPLLAAEAPLE